MKDYLLTRVDDRLLHGQVALGWRHALDPECFLIVDDEVAQDPLAIRLFDAAVPEGMRLAIVEESAFLAGAETVPSPERTILLIRDLAGIARLCERGFRPREVNLGGIHHRASARRFLDYLFLTDEDRARARRLIDFGIVLYAQDLPFSPRRPVEELLATGGTAA